MAQTGAEIETDSGGDPDSRLLAAAVAGDRDAFGALLRRHYDRIHGLAWQLTGSRADADDIAQDVCCTLVEKIGGFRGEAKFTTWLCSIVFNACRDFRRRRRSFSGFTAPETPDTNDAVSGCRPRQIHHHRAESVQGRPRRTGLDLLDRCRHRLLFVRPRLAQPECPAPAGGGADRGDGQLFPL
jgi:DNA-directed RNA polymerase specialized sigma24 family protein